MCKTCGKKRGGRNIAPPPAPENWATKADLGWPMIEFIGRNTSSMLFKNTPTGRRYTLGNNTHHKIARVHPQDLDHFLRFVYIREYTDTTDDEKVLVAQPTPNAPRPITRTPKTPPPLPPASNEVIIGDMRVRDVWEFDFTGHNIVGLIEDEKANKNRSSVVAFLARLQRKMEKKR